VNRPKLGRFSKRPYIGPLHFHVLRQFLCPGTFLLMARATVFWTTTDTDSRFKM